MIGVEDAAKRIAAAFSPIDTEIMDVGHLAGRVLAEDAIARTNQPPFPVSGVDGFAVRLADGATARNLVGTAPAGHPFKGRLVEGDAVRISTGSVMPEGADAIVLLEDAKTKLDTVSFKADAMSVSHVRAAGSDFKSGALLAKTGKRLGARDCALLAAGDLAQMKVRRRPRVAIVSIGDELSRPGEAHLPGRIAASSGYGLSAMIQTWGGAPCDFGILPDTGAEIVTVADADADLIVTLGGVSVGDHALVEKALGTRDFELDFWNVDVPPGKPLIFGRLGRKPLIGLPGHPVSTLVCAILFLKPAVAAMLGTAFETDLISAKLISPLPAGGERQAYLRARMERRWGEYWVEAFPVQELSALSLLAKADALIARAPGARAVETGDRIDTIPLFGL